MLETIYASKIKFLIASIFIFITIILLTFIMFLDKLGPFLLSPPIWILGFWLYRTISWSRNPYSLVLDETGFQWVSNSKKGQKFYWKDVDSFSIVDLYRAGKTVGVTFQDCTGYSPLCFERHSSFCGVVLRGWWEISPEALLKKMSEFKKRVDQDKSASDNATLARIESSKRLITLGGTMPNAESAPRHRSDV